MKTKLSYAVSFFETLAHFYFNKTTKANLLKHSGRALHMTAEHRLRNWRLSL